MILMLLERVEGPHFENYYIRVSDYTQMISRYIFEILKTQRIIYNYSFTSLSLFIAFHPAQLKKKKPSYCSFGVEMYSQEERYLGFSFSLWMHPYSICYLLLLAPQAYKGENKHSIKCWCIVNGVHCMLNIECWYFVVLFCLVLLENTGDSKEHVQKEMMSQSSRINFPSVPGFLLTESHGLPQLYYISSQSLF